MYVCLCAALVEVWGQMGGRKTTGWQIHCPLHYFFVPSLARVASTRFLYLSPFYYLTPSVFCNHSILKIGSVLLLSLLHPTLSLLSLFISWFSISLFALIISLNLQAPCICSSSLSSPLLCTVDHSPVRPLAFYNSNSFPGNQVLYSLCNMVLSAGILYACRYECKLASSHMN